MTHKCLRYELHRQESDVDVIADRLSDVYPSLDFTGHLRADLSPLSSIGLLRQFTGFMIPRGILEGTAPVQCFCVHLHTAGQLVRNLCRPVMRKREDVSQHLGVSGDTTNHFHSCLAPQDR